MYCFRHSSRSISRMTVIRIARTRRTPISAPTITPTSVPLPCGVVVSVGVGEGERKEEEEEEKEKGEKGEGGGSILLSRRVGGPVREKTDAHVCILIALR